VLVAGTSTPIAMSTLDQPLRGLVLGVAWFGALVGIALAVVWITAPRWIAAGSYVALGWAVMAAVPQIHGEAGSAVLGLLLAGGARSTPPAPSWRSGSGV
jgi:hemolysin III